MSTSQEPEIKQKFKELYVDYKLAVAAAYFTEDPSEEPAGADTAMQWEGPHGITASVEHPVLARLAAPKLHPDLAAHLERK